MESGDCKNLIQIELGSVKDSCRICMAQDPNMIYLFHEERLKIIEEIQFCTGVLIISPADAPLKTKSVSIEAWCIHTFIHSCLQLRKEDGLPSRICNECINNLSIAFKFKNACLMADSTLRKILKPTIKIEVVEFDIKEDLDTITEKDNPTMQNDNHKTQNDHPIMQNDDHKSQHDITHLITQNDDMKTQCDNRIMQNDDHKIDYEESDTDEDYFGDSKLTVEIIENNLISNSVRKSSRVKLKEENNGTANHKIRRTRIKRSSKKKEKKPLKQSPATRPKPSSLTCDPCNLKFENKEQAFAHRKEKHRDTECWVCEICGKLFVHRASHYSHVKSHQPPSYACDQCDYRTWYKHDLAKHLYRHSGVKQYQCEYCTASYYTSSNLLSHIRRFHQKEKRYSCPMCDKRFFDRTKVNRHIDTHNEVKRYECEICHAFFSRRCYWKKHRLRQHNIVTPRQRPGRQKTNHVVGQDLADIATSKEEVVHKTSI